MENKTFENPAYQAAREIKRILSSESFQLKPHSHHQLNGNWWLIPPQLKTKKQGPPFYHLGKFTFSVRNHKEKSFLRTGVHVEKGSEYSTPTGDTWFWHTFLRRVKEGTFESDLAKLSKKIGDEIYITIDGHQADKSCRLSYVWKEEACCLITEDPNKLNCSDIFKVIPPDEDGIGRIIEVLSENQWTWLDVYVEVEIPLMQEKKVEAQVNELWYKGLHLLQKYASE
jgi:hypothetical protein